MSMHSDWLTPQARSFLMAKDSSTIIRLPRTWRNCCDYRSGLKEANRKIRLVEKYLAKHFYAAGVVVRGVLASDKTSATLQYSAPCCRNHKRSTPQDKARCRKR